VWLLFYILLLMNGDHRVDHSQRAVKGGAADAANMTVIETTRVRALHQYGEAAR